MSGVREARKQGLGFIRAKIWEKDGMSLALAGPLKKKDVDRLQEEFVTGFRTAKMKKVQELLILIWKETLKEDTTCLVPGTCNLIDELVLQHGWDHEAAVP